MSKQDNCKREYECDCGLDFNTEQEFLEHLEENWTH